MKIHPLVALRSVLLATLGVFVLLSFSSCQTNKNLQPAEATTTAGVGGFDAADENSDGKLSRKEASDFLVDEIFTSRDANHDGRMTLEEWWAGDKSRAAQFKSRDKDHDGVITRDEARAYGRTEKNLAKDIMRDGDKNGDGLLDKAEVEAYYKRHEGPRR